MAAVCVFCGGTSFTEKVNARKCNLCQAIQADKFPGKIIVSTTPRLSTTLRQTRLKEYNKPQ